jgi:hypothetical protein
MNKMGSVFLMREDSLAILAEFYADMATNLKESDSATGPIIRMRWA